jgi:hypothetical protein
MHQPGEITREQDVQALSEPRGSDDPASGEPSPKVGRALLAAQHPISCHRNLGDGSADDERMDEAPGGLDLGELRHGPP